MSAGLRMLLHPMPVRLDPAPVRSSKETGTWSLPGRSQSRALLTYHGTAAVYQAVRSLGLSAGERVLIPSYNCGHELEPVLRAGASVGFYRINEALEVDLDELADAIDSSTRAVLVTHYFGFPQNLEPIRRLCDRHGLALIEDCAHALFSYSGAEPLGVTGDFAVYSLRKSLPLPHGGAVVCNDRRWWLPRSLRRPPRLSTAVKWLDRHRKGLVPPQSGAGRVLSVPAFVLARLAVDLGHGLAAVSRLAGALQWDPDDESIEFPAAVLDWGVAASVESALERVCPQSIVTARRRNFLQLLDACSQFVDCRALIDRLPPGVCPLYFPVVTADPAALLGRLGRRAISAVQWWDDFHPAVPWDQFPESQALKRSVVVLPIHQDLRDTHMDRIIAVLEGGWQNRLV